MKQRIIDASGYKQFLFDAKELKAYMADAGAHAYYFSIYSTVLDDARIQQVCSWIEEQFPGADYYGCTSFVNIIRGHSNNEKIVVVCTLAESASTRFKVMHFDKTKIAIDDFAKYLYEYISENPWIRSAEFIVASSLNHSRNVLCDLASKIPESISIVGGCAFNEHFDLMKNYVFTKHGGITTEGMCILFTGGDNYYSKVRKIEGWKPLFRKFELTKVDKNKIVEIDHRPAAEILERYLGIPNDENIPFAAIEFPLFYTENETDYMLRSILYSDSNGSLVTGSYVKEGAHVQLTFGEISSVMNTIDEVIDDMIDFVPDNFRAYSCAARYNWWGNRINEELSPISAVAPVNGLFTAGEFVRIDGDVQFCNCTLVLKAEREGIPKEPVQKPKHDHSAALTTSMRLARFIGVIIQELEEKNDELKRLAVTDVLSGVYNRGALNDIIRQLADNHTPFSLIMMDIDDFKNVNDCYGHDEGDKVIQRLALVITEEAKATHAATHVGRWGGEEFMVIVESDDIAVAETLGRNICDRFGKETYDIAPSKTISVGATLSAEGDSEDSVVKRVDEALYSAKAQGKNRVITIL
ncbi:MAG: diguanylate cyclase [Blautia sp.]|nr:diguanylate cyclase [Blautia sp.]